MNLNFQDTTQNGWIELTWQQVTIMEAGGGGGGSSGSSNVAKVSQHDLKPYHATLYGRKRNLKYRGQMVGNMKEGWGSLVYNDGSQYIGNWQVIM